MLHRTPRWGDRSELALERRSYRESTRVVAHSRLMRDELVELYGLDPAKISVIYPPVNTAEFFPGPSGDKSESKRRFGLSPEKTTLFFPSTGHARKGLPLLLDALRHLPPDRFELAVAGSGSGALRAEYTTTLRYLGFIKNMADAYRAVDFTILPSHYEPFGLVITESVACGTPVITHRRVGACDLIGDREGVIFDALTPQSLRDAILNADARREEFHIAPDFCARNHLTVAGHIDELLRASGLSRRT
jgi:glycosyltransferase involved in cell wall biosynthesis